MKIAKKLVIGFKRTRANGMRSHIILMNFLKRLIKRSYLLYYLNYESNFINPLLENYSMIFKQLSNKYKLIIIKDSEELDILDTNLPLINESIIFNFRKCINRNGFVYLVYDKNKLIFRARVQIGRYLAHIIGNAFIKIPELDYYIEDCYTHITYRGQKIYPWVLNEIRKELLKTKDIKLYIATDVENISSRKGIERAGFNLKENYVILNIFLRTYKLHEVVYFGESNLIRTS